MPGGSGGVDAIRMINRQQRSAARYRRDRASRRRDLRAGHDHGPAGEVHACGVCGQQYDVNFLLREGGAWTCEACDFRREADEAVGAHGELGAAGVFTGLAVLVLVLAQVWAYGTAGVIAGVTAPIVVPLAGLLFVRSHGLRRAGVWHPMLVAQELGAGLLAVTVLVNGAALCAVPAVLDTLYALGF